MSPIIQSLANASAYGYRSFAAAVTDTGAYFPLQVVTVGSAGAADVTFTNIPSTYSHLQIRVFARGTETSDTVNVTTRVGNGSIDTNSNYAWHQLYGDGSSTGASAGTTQSFMYMPQVATDLNSASIYGSVIIDILDYANTNKYKTLRGFGGFDANGSGKVFLRSGLWQSTSAINTVRLYPNSGNWKQYSQFALYGIKGA